ncbi:ABC transporter ATP-binding protein [Salinigranum salinum]|uniref:ABC transporter ATP-binding protein n=1 Tax=Salinigranum salinum TaxID=1364937 RepID=UPI001260DC7E|nr:ABC transporter ATP-binding protein [Salinigranum salinum]
MSDAGPVLRTEGLRKSFGGFVAVDGVDFELAPGELRGLIGPNGAGKTTFFNMLSGMLDPSQGTIWFKGEDITDMPPHRITRQGMSLAFQITSVFPDMTVMENVLGALNGQKAALNPLGSYAGDVEGKRRAMEILTRVGLEDNADATVENLSHGDQKVLEIALALAGDPDLLLLDEPTAGLSASETRQVTGLLEELHGEITIMLIEHDMDVVMRLADTLTVLHNGQVIAEGTPDEIRENEQVKEVYFGRGH